MPDLICTSVSLQADKISANLNGQSRDLEYLVKFNLPSATTSHATAANDGTTQVLVVGETRTLAVHTPGYVDGVLQVIESDVEFIVGSADAERLAEDPCAFKVRVQLVPLVRTMEPRPEGENIRWRVDLSVDSTLYTEPVSVDSEGAEIRIQTGEPVDPPLQKEYFDREYNLSFRSDFLDIDNWELCGGNVNDAEITMTVRGQAIVFPVGTLKFMYPRASIVYESDGSSCWQNQAKLLYRKDTWISKVQGKSLYHLDGSGNLVPNRDAKNVPLALPQFLTEDGTDYVRQNEELPDPLEFQVPELVSFAELLDGIATIV